MAEPKTCENCTEHDACRQWQELGKPTERERAERREERLRMSSEHAVRDGEEPLVK